MSDRRYEDISEDKPEFNRVGHELKLAGVLFAGMGEYWIFLLPEQSLTDLGMAINQGEVELERLTSHEWTALLKRSDDPLIYLADSTGTAKAWVRKLQFQISGDVQQKVFARDGFKCMYCHRMMGEVTLSIDHFMPLELGGANDPSNFLAVCKKQNKDKGNMHPKDWCSKKGYDYEYYVNYLKEKNK